jgi:hypothetical protein
VSFTDDARVEILEYVAEEDLVVGFQEWRKC